MPPQAAWRELPVLPWMEKLPVTARELLLKSKPPAARGRRLAAPARRGSVWLQPAPQQASPERTVGLASA